MSKFPTPSYSHLKTEDFDHLYEPAEDTFLLLDALEADADFIRSRNPSLCLEVGPGSGVVITFLATILGPNAFFLASDINQRAALSGVTCGNENKVDVNSTTDDMLTSFRPRLKHQVDILLFNPPYVVTPHEEVGGTSLSAAWAGGIKGREVIDRFLPLVDELLSDTGVLYLLLLEQNDPDDVIRVLLGYQLICTVLLKRKAGPEHLLVLRVSRR